MELIKLIITVEPDVFNTNFKMLKVNAITQDNQLNFQRMLYTNDFESFFDSVMDIAKREIKELAKQENKINESSTNMVFVKEEKICQTTKVMKP